MRNIPGAPGKTWAASASALFALGAVPAFAQASDQPDSVAQISATGEALAQSSAEQDSDDSAPTTGHDELGAAAAADAAIGTRQVYTPADFAAFQPRSALDMVQQLPGFSIDGAGNNNRNNNNRGLGQANGNVLLNGLRIVTKAGSITDELARIPASTVIRIEVVEGSTLNIPGLSGRVANVIARSTDGLQGQFEWRPQLAAEYADTRWLEGIASLSGTYGNLGFTVAVEGRPVRNGNAGPNIVTYGNGFVEDRFSLFKAAGDDKRLSGSLRYQTVGGTLINANASYLHRRFHSFEDEMVVGPVGTPPLTDMFRQRNKGHDFEIGGDIDFELGPGRLKLITLDSLQSLNFRTRSVLDPATGAPPIGVMFAQSSEKGERIGRGEYSWSMWSSDWQWSFEGAFNKLDLVGDLSILDAAGAFNPIPFPAGTGGVREDRYESMLSFSHQLAEGLTMQLIAGSEYSWIRQTGSNANSRKFLRPKGSLTLGWTPGPSWTVSARIDRRVGQLNFNDFLAAVNLNDNNQNAGNNDLRPDQSWGGELEVTKDLGAWGSATLRTFMRRFEDYVTIVPTPSGGEARGNIDWARVMGVELTSTLKLDPVGFDGAKFDISASFRDSRFPDPVGTGYLPVQFAQPHNVDVNFRYDVPQSDWALGAGFRDTGNNPYYRVAEYGYDYAIARNLQVLVEHKDVFGLTVQARVSNLLNSPVVLDRWVYLGPRDVAPLAFHENRQRYVGHVVNFTVKGSF
ncbi:TonB-dependent receptor plug domain-containing protein [Altererythrobacter salegens]|uniref:TonB-dependent receptor plug domain-containing protein n=1 Tax=Croceibacterium salegens TaxID=1737568 RepID=A0A6I4SQR8_9SPHN|nr:TonB-dependent receptor [Croceibacterium salegens]MXO58155.1 TonB-dependent receptor plug domain-containing protein [Croceibacterium salegens]